MNSISERDDSMDKVKFEVVVWGGGWEDYKLSVNDTEHYLLTTCIWAKYELGELIEALCCMSPDYYQYCYGTDYAYNGYYDWNPGKREKQILCGEDCRLC